MYQLALVDGNHYSLFISITAVPPQKDHCLNIRQKTNTERGFGIKRLRLNEHMAFSFIQQMDRT